MGYNSIGAFLELCRCHGMTSAGVGFAARVLFSLSSFFFPWHGHPDSAFRGVGKACLELVGGFMTYRDMVWKRRTECHRSARVYITQSFPRRNDCYSGIVKGRVLVGNGRDATMSRAMPMAQDDTL